MKTLTERLASASGIAEADQALILKLRRMSKTSRDGMSLAAAAKRIEALAKQRAAYQQAINEIDDFFEYRTAGNMEKWTEQSRTQVYHVIGRLRESLAKTK